MRYGTLVLILGLSVGHAEAQAAQCSSYYISEINLVSTVDAVPGNVQTFVGFGLSKEESEKNAIGACSHVRFDMETCLDSDRASGLNTASDSTNSALHLKYRKAVKRITGCS
ncbi:hypothetical protein JQ596_35060 [Bradyrhizobium manausense]|uniref:hypothetical protein n=1 Tax=Bradyrhizobium TaxID=374 RepID=UPI001BA7CA59|nr:MULTISPECIES: hypothetical protein [Bradyrhizobium]MBR0830738.1 hypothetical protein [Bradyrhizobium manausense]UVO28722.1 hypothetical protein KUF59_40845 [Bradyrhizobium arachidis]